MASCRVENRAKKAQNGTVSASQLVKASQNAIFFSTQQISIVLLYCVQSLVGKGRFLATKRAQKRVCIVCLASAAILPFLVTSPDIQFWLSAALLLLLCTILGTSYLPSRLRFSANCAFFGQAVSRGNYHPI